MDCCWPISNWISKSGASAIPKFETLKCTTMFACIHVRNPRAAASAHASLLDCASAFSPRVEDTMPGTVILDIEGLQHLFGSTAELAQHLKDYVSALGSPVHLGIASNPDAAMCAARGWPGTTILERGAEAARLKGLDIALLP